jgi:hypothetical protein
VPEVCAIAADARRNEKTIKLALTRAPILREFNIMPPLCCGTRSLTCNPLDAFSDVVYWHATWENARVLKDPARTD